MNDTKCTKNKNLTRSPIDKHCHKTCHKTSFHKTSNLSKAHVKRDSSSPDTLAISVGPEQ